jgi:hypothetical protein
LPTNAVSVLQQKNVGVRTDTQRPRQRFVRTQTSQSLGNDLAYRNMTQFVTACHRHSDKLAICRSYPSCSEISTSPTLTADIQLGISVDISMRYRISIRNESIDLPLYSSIAQNHSYLLKNTQNSNEYSRETS